MSIINTGSVVSGAAGTYDNVASSKESGTSIGTLNSVAQILAGTMSVSPPGAFAFSPMAAVITTAKINDDIKNGKPINPADILAITGNILAVIGGVAVLANPATLGVATLISLTVTGTAIATSRGAITLPDLDDVQKLANSINGMTSGLADQIANNVGETAINTHNAITNGINNTKNTLNDIASGKAFRDSMDKLAPKIGETAINMDKAINEAMANGAEKVNDAIQKATDAYKTAEQKIADSYKTAEQALKDGIKNAEHIAIEALEKAEQIAKELAKEVSDTFKEISDELSNAFDKFKEAVQDTFDKWREQVGDFFAKFDFPNIPTDWLPDIVKDWLDLPRSGEYHIYDPLTLDLNGNGIIDVIGTDGYKGALFVHDNLNIPAINEEERWAA